MDGTAAPDYVIDAVDILDIHGNGQAQTLEIAVSTRGLDEAMVAGNIVGIARNIPSHIRSRAIVLDEAGMRKLLNLLLNMNLNNDFPGAEEGGLAAAGLVGEGVDDEQGNFHYHSRVVSIMAGSVPEYRRAVDPVPA